MKKYLVIYEEKDSLNGEVIRYDDFDDLTKAIEWITDIEAFGEVWDTRFISLLETKEVPVNISDSKIKLLREKKRLENEEDMKRYDAKMAEFRKKNSRHIQE